jgi:hypothetical protein
MESLNFIEEVALLGLAGEPEGCTLKEVLKLLGKNGHVSPSLLGAALERMEELGLVEKLPRPARSKSDRWRLLPKGEASVALPETCKRGWKVVPLRALAASHALKLTPVAAAGLVKRGQLSAWFLADRLGQPFTPATTLESLAGLIMAQALGTANAQPATLWGAMMRRAAAKETRVEVASTAPSPSAGSGDFATEVLQSAHFVPAAGWFGPRKLFIHRAHESWRRQTHGTLDLAQFKGQLLTEMRAGNLGLARADFTATLSPEDLQQSEIRDGAEIFHFIATERPSSIV